MTENQAMSMLGCAMIIAIAAAVSTIILWCNAGSVDDSLRSANKHLYNISATLNHLSDLQSLKQLSYIASNIKEAAETYGYEEDADEERIYTITEIRKKERD